MNDAYRFILLSIVLASAWLASDVSAAGAHGPPVASGVEASASAHHEDPRALAAARQGGGDADGDGVDDFADNCVTVANANQRDSDRDGFGNACDADLNNDGVVNAGDLGLLKQAFFSSPGDGNWNPNADLNGDDSVTFADLGLMRETYFSTPGPSGMACAGTSPCPPFALEFFWPMPGSDAEDWVINNYVDLDPSGGILDYAGGAKSYDGHRGVDIDVPTFRAMDNNFPILAVAQGTVLALEDGNFDRNTSCTGSWNYVTVGHPNGWKTIYGHLKKNSVVVQVGDIVNAGTTLAVVGSSGCSTAPHLHLETIDENGVTVEPFAEGMWLSPPVYNTPLGFMDAALYADPITNVDMIKDPAENVDIVPPGETLGLGISMAGGSAGDTILLRIATSTSIVGQTSINFNQSYRHSYWWWNHTLESNASGEHFAQVFLNGSLAASYTIDVQPILTGYYQVRHGVPIANYQALFDLMTANGYRVTWIDGYQVGANTYVNAIFDRSQVVSWSSSHAMTANQYQDYFDSQTASGRRLVHVDSFRLGSATRYAAIFVEEQIGPFWGAYHDVSESSHQDLFDLYVQNGYRASVISVTDEGNGNRRYTALYDTIAVGSWAAHANLTSAQYQTQFNAQIATGRRLAYINAYDNNGVPNFTAIWNSVQPSSWVARHDLTSSQFQNEFDQWTSAGLVTRLITGYESGGIARFAGYWTD